MLALVLSQALVVSTATGSLLHVHDYTGHDHPDHHHGPASHEHHVYYAVEHREDHHDEEERHGGPVASGDSCDPGRHAVAVTMGCAHVPQLQLTIAELPGPAIFAPSTTVRSSIPITDVRVHGPPFDTRSPSRGPPLIALA